MNKYAIITAILLNVLCLSPVLASPAPQFSLPTMTGSVNLNDLKGKLVYVDFWASWCVPCRKSFPWMNEIQKRYADKGFIIVAINLDKDKKFVEKFLKKYPANFIVALDPKGNSASAYKVQGMPSSYLVDQKGDLKYTHIGFREKSKNNIELQIKELLKRR